MTGGIVYVYASEQRAPAGSGRSSRCCLQLELGRGSRLEVSRGGLVVSLHGLGSVSGTGGAGPGVCAWSRVSVIFLDICVNVEIYVPPQKRARGQNGLCQMLMAHLSSYAIH